MVTAREIGGYSDFQEEEGQEAPFWFHVRLAHSQIGPIRCCGSSLLEGAAAVVYGSNMTDSRIHEIVSRQATRLDISREQVTELLVRWSVFEDFDDVIGDALSVGVREKLRDILEEVVYPHIIENGQLPAAQA